MAAHNCPMQTLGGNKSGVAVGPVPEYEHRGRRGRSGGAARVGPEVGSSPEQWQTSWILTTSCQSSCPVLPSPYRFRTSCERGDTSGAPLQYIYKVGLPHPRHGGDIDTTMTYMEVLCAATGTASSIRGNKPSVPRVFNKGH